MCTAKKKRDDIYGQRIFFYDPFTISIKSVLILIDGLILLKYFRPLPMIWYTVYNLDQRIFTE